MKYPITVNKISIDPELSKPVVEPWFGASTGDMVAVRPCADKYEGKTYLGVMLGDMIIGYSAKYKEDTGELMFVPGMRNPAVFIPETNDIVFGCESWWGKITSEDKLRKITDEDISNVWYVKALKQVQEAQEAKDSD